VKDKCVIKRLNFNFSQPCTKISSPPLSQTVSNVVGVATLRSQQTVYKVVFTQIFNNFHTPIRTVNTNCHSQDSHVCCYSTWN